ncbi:MAG: ketoacyl-ACP synthase III [Archangiaceae bacterium]|nr:ketoacyl-ACP synthase III [Archangiaceae bacterium]
MRAHIIGTGSYVPEKVLTNRDLEKIVETTDEWIVERTGIRERHVAAPGENTSDMAVKAAIRALEMASTRADELDLIIVGTVTPDMPMPACAAFVAHKLGATKAFAFDLSAACAGSLFGLSVASQFIETGKAKRVLVIGVELLTRIVDWKDRNTCVLFGDAAGAMVVGPSNDESRGIISTHLHTDGAQTGILCIPGGGSKTPVTHETVDQRLQFVSMNGRDVYKFAVRALTDAVHEAFTHNNITADHVTHLVAHQANVRIIDAVLERVKVPKEKAFLNIDKYGNTSSASLPMTLDEANRAGKLKPNDTILMMAIGAGMSWGSAIVRW